MSRLSVSFLSLDSNYFQGWCFRHDTKLGDGEDMPSPDWGAFNSLQTLHVDILEFELPGMDLDPEKIEAANAIPLALFFTEQSSKRPSNPFRFSNLHLLKQPRSTVTGSGAQGLVTDSERVPSKRTVRDICQDRQLMLLVYDRCGCEYQRYSTWSFEFYG